MMRTARLAVLLAGVMVASCGGDEADLRSAAGTPDLAMRSPELRKQVEGLREQLAAHPQESILWMDLALTLHANGEEVRSEDAYDRALELDAGNPFLRYMRAHALWAAGRSEAAVEELERCIAVGPVYLPALRTAALWNLQIGRVERAREHADRAFAHDPEAPGVRAVKGRIALSAGRIEEAVRVLTPPAPNVSLGPYVEFLAARAAREVSGSAGRVAELEPVAPPLWPDPWLSELSRYIVGAQTALNRAEAALARGEPDAAIEALSLHHESRPEHPRITQVLALAHRARGDYRTAITLLEEASASQPDVFEHVLQLSATLYLAAGAANDPDLLREAHAAATHLVDRWPSDWRAHAVLADILAGGRDFEGAAEAYRRCAALAPTSAARCEIKASRALLASGRRGEAEQLLVATFGETPEDPAAAGLLRASRNPE